MHLTSSAFPNAEKQRVTITCWPHFMGEKRSGDDASIKRVIAAVAILEYAREEERRIHGCLVRMPDPHELLLVLS